MLLIAENMLLYPYSYSFSDITRFKNVAAIVLIQAMIIWLITLKLVVLDDIEDPVHGLNATDQGHEFLFCFVDFV